MHLGKARQTNLGKARPRNEKPKAASSLRSSAMALALPTMALGAFSPTVIRNVVSRSSVSMGVEAM